MKISKSNTQPTGEIDDGAVRLTLPADWSMATSEIVEVSRSGAVWGGDEDADSRDEEGISEMQVLVKGVNLSARGTITFTYTGMVQMAKEDGVQFVVASDGGAGPGEDVMDIADLSDLTVDVDEAAAGSGGAKAAPEFVTVGDEDVELTFTYIAAGRLDTHGSSPSKLTTIGQRLPPMLMSRAATPLLVQKSLLRMVKRCGHVSRMGRRLRAKVRLSLHTPPMHLWRLEPPVSR